MASPTRTARLQAEDHRHLWHPFTQQREWEHERPLIIERGRGVYLEDTDGHRYLDGVSSLWVNLHGHRKRELDRALAAQLKKIAHSTLLGLANVPSIELARRLVALAPRGLTRVFYSDDGSTAVEVALKMAYQYWQLRGGPDKSKKSFLHLGLAYHGDTLGAVSVGGVPLFHERFKPLLFPTYEAHAPYCYRCPLNLTYPQCRVACVDAVEDVLKRHHGHIAALIVEPMLLAAGGMITMPPGYLTRLRRLCSRYRVLLIADEVATGFGRTGRMFACEHENVKPDLMAISKGMTGGYLPLAATLTTERIYRAFLGRYEEFKTFFHGHSYTGNPLGCAVALANLDIFARERTLRQLQSKIAALRRLLRPLGEHPHVGDIRQLGFLVGIELVRDRATKQPYPLIERIGMGVAAEARRLGLIIRPRGNVIVPMQPLSTTTKELRQMVESVTTGIRAVTSASTPGSTAPTRRRGSPRFSSSRSRAPRPWPASTRPACRSSGRSRPSARPRSPARAGRFGPGRRRAASSACPRCAPARSAPGTHGCPGRAHRRTPRGAGHGGSFLCLLEMSRGSRCRRCPAGSGPRRCRAGPPPESRARRSSCPPPSRARRPRPARA